MTFFYIYLPGAWENASGGLNQRSHLWVVCCPPRQLTTLHGNQLEEEAMERIGKGMQRPDGNTFRGIHASSRLPALEKHCAYSSIVMSCRLFDIDAKLSGGHNGGR